MMKDARAEGATPILVAPPARAAFSGDMLTDQSNLHAADVQAVATAQNVAFIDLTSITTDWYNQLGPNGWQAYHALRTDATHTNRAGAAQIAGFVAAAIAEDRPGRVHAIGERPTGAPGCLDAAHQLRDAGQHRRAVPPPERDDAPIFMPQPLTSG